MDAHTDISKVYQERILKEICDFICQERQKFATRCEDRVSKKIKYLSEKNDKGEILPVEIDDNVCVCENIDPTIILILESPGKDEYDSSSAEMRLAPARGPMGRNINAYFIPLLKSDKEHRFDEWRIGLINPIQYSCSFGGMLPTKRKENIFNDLFCDPIKDDFVRRLNIMRRSKEYIVMNCCTKAGSSMIDNILESNSIPFIKMPHPSSRWFAVKCCVGERRESRRGYKIDIVKSDKLRSCCDTLSIDILKKMIAISCAIQKEK